MIYRTLGKTGIKVSEIGLGNVYFEDQPREVVVSIIHEAIKNGVNYFDCASNIPDLIENMGIALNGYQDKVVIGGHIGSGEENGQYKILRNLKECKKSFIRFLNFLKIDKVDILFVHNVSAKEIDNIFGEVGLLDLALKLKDEGLTNFIGLSTHDSITGIKAIESGKVDVLLYPINLVSNASPGKRELFQACEDNNIGLVGMKPFAGGKLMQRNLTVYNSDDNNYSRISPVTWEKLMQRKQPVSPIQCLHYVLSQPGVSTTVPGIKNVQELKENLHYFKATEEEKDYTSLMLDFKDYFPGQCVYCNHCLPCPSEIDVGNLNRMIDIALNDLSNSTRKIENLEEILIISDKCIECGVCSERCPFNVDVVLKINNFKALYGNEQSSVINTS